MKMRVRENGERHFERSVSDLSTFSGVYMGNFLFVSHSICDCCPDVFLLVVI